MRWAVLDTPKRQREQVTQRTDAACQPANQVEPRNSLLKIQQPHEEGRGRLRNCSKGYATPSDTITALLHWTIVSHFSEQPTCFANADG